MMSHMLQKYSLDQLRVIQMCEGTEKEEIIKELLMMKETLDPVMNSFFEEVIYMVEDLPEEELKRILVFTT